MSDFDCFPFDFKNLAIFDKRISKNAFENMYGPASLDKSGQN